VSRRLTRLGRNLFGRRRVDERLSREVDAYLELLIDDKMAAGLDRHEARRVALAEMGGLESIKEQVRDVRAGVWIEQTWRDLWHAWRWLRHHPAFTLVVLSTLTLGIGANTAIFQLIDVVRLRTLPVERPNELVKIQLASMEGARGSFSTAYDSVTYPIFQELVKQSDPFASLFAWSPDSSNLASGGEARPARTLWVSGEFFPALGVRPALGHLFGPGDDRPGCAPGVVLSDGFWRREYGGDRGVTDRTLAIGGKALPIVGVTPSSFFGLEVGRGFDIALPLCAEPYIRGPNSRLRGGTNWWLIAMGRLKPGWTIDRAASYERSISASVFRSSLPSNYPSVSIKQYLAFTLTAVAAATGESSVRTQYSDPLTFLAVIAALVLAIACANIASLLLAQASARERETAVRLAIGASRWRLIRQSMIQSLLLAALGGCAGILLGGALSRFLVTFLSVPGDPVFLDLHSTWRVLGFTAGLVLMTCLIFGVAPALRMTGADPGVALKNGGRGTTEGRAHLRLRRSLVVAQIALSLVLLVGALLFTTTLRNLMRADVGFQTDGLLAASVGFRSLNVPAERIEGFKRDLAERLRAIPGVEARGRSRIDPARRLQPIEQRLDRRAAAATTSGSAHRCGRPRLLQGRAHGTRRRPRIRRSRPGRVGAGRRRQRSFCARVAERGQSDRPAAAHRSDANRARDNVRDRRTREEQQVSESARRFSADRLSVCRTESASGPEWPVSASFEITGSRAHRVGEGHGCCGQSADRHPALDRVRSNSAIAAARTPDGHAVQLLRAGRGPAGHRRTLRPRRLPGRT
jgi:hypothetical protein